METKIGVVIVLFHPKEFNYKELVHQADVSVILVDNTPDSDLNLTSGNVYYIPLKQNKGIAAAQNIGIRKAKELGCLYIVFFDQDSEVEADYIGKMRTEYERIKEKYPRMAVLGPTIVNKENGEKYKSTNKKRENGCVILPALISSGSMMKSDILEKVGVMDEKLFIDYVDFEWCWRAGSQGYICCITSQVELYHKVGQHDFSFFNIPIIVSAPVRYYYQYRNYMWLIRRSYVPKEWKLKMAIRKLWELLFLPFGVDGGKFIARNMFRGIKDGIFCKD